MNFINKLRWYRRRYKLSFGLTLFMIVIIIMILSNFRFQFDETEVDIHLSLIDFDKLNVFNYWKGETVPFSKTDAAATSEKNLNINNFDNLHDGNKIMLIDQYNGENEPSTTDFFRKIFKIYDQYKPNVLRLNNYKSDQRIYHARYNSKDDDEEDDRIIFSEAYLSSFLQLSEPELKAMMKSHQNVVKNLPSKAPKGVYSGNGIVYVGGGKYNWLTLLSIKSVRDLGSQLPIEILIPSLEEFESNLCFKIFPQFNAKCILLPRALNKYPGSNQAEDKENTDDDIFKKFDFKGYQYKALAILLSSFENVLFLDSDNIPVRNPDALFESEPFTSHGLIVWPDFWKRATSPRFYDIANINIDKTKFLPRYNEIKSDYEDVDYSQYKETEIPFHQYQGTIPDPTSESGQLMISKKTHLKVLLLSLYYNLYGPNYYYQLFSQGSDGEGDKETFLAACVALKSNFYQVKSFLKALGYFDSNIKFIGTGMGQFNPITDYESKGHDLLFIHANFPKLNPWQLKQEDKIFDNDNRIRLYGNGIKNSIKFDFELNQWLNMHNFLCDLNISFSIFKDVDHEELCNELREHIAFLKSTTDIMEDAL